MLYFFDDIIKAKYSVYKSKRSIGKKEYIESCYEKIFKLFPHYFNGINKKYITDLFNNPSVKMLVYTNELMMENIKKEHIIGLIIYYKFEYKYYVLALGIHCIYRNMGYGTIMLDEFVDYVREFCTDSNEIIVDSLSSTTEFYKSYGFFETDESFCKELAMFEDMARPNSTSYLLVYNVFN